MAETYGRMMMPLSVLAGAFSHAAEAAETAGTQA